MLMGLLRHLFPKQESFLIVMVIIQLHRMVVARQVLKEFQAKESLYEKAAIQNKDVVREIYWAIIEEFLRQHISGLSDAPLRVEQFSAGYSNLTYFIRMGDWQADSPTNLLSLENRGSQGREIWEIGRRHQKPAPAGSQSPKKRNPALTH